MNFDMMASSAGIDSRTFLRNRLKDTLKLKSEMWPAQKKAVIILELEDEEISRTVLDLSCL